MRQDFTRIAVVLDRSGSMQSLAEAVVSGFNAFVAEQKKLPGEGTIKLVQFDDVIETVWDTRLAEVPELTARTYVPRGSTALLDAQGSTIDALGRELAAMPEAERPDKVIVMTMTDGYENASKQYSARQVADMVREQRERYGWEFLYLGANQDAVATAAAMNIPAGSAISFMASPAAAANVMGMASRKLTSRRSRAEDSDFTAEERVAAMSDQDAGGGAGAGGAGGAAEAGKPWWPFGRKA